MARPKKSETTKKIETPKKVGRPVEAATLAEDKPVGPDTCPECACKTTGHKGCNHLYCAFCGWGK